MNTQHKRPYKGKYGGGPRFRRYTREELVADSSVGYYTVLDYLAKLESWRFHDIKNRLTSLLEWGAWRFNSEQKEVIKSALLALEQDLKSSQYRTKFTAQALRRAQQGKLFKNLPTPGALARRKKAIAERNREAVANYYKKSA